MSAQTTPALLEDLATRLQLIEDTVMVVIEALKNNPTAEMHTAAVVLQNHVANPVTDCIEIIEQTKPAPAT